MLVILTNYYTKIPKIYVRDSATMTLMIRILILQMRIAWLCMQIYAANFSLDCEIINFFSEPDHRIRIINLLLTNDSNLIYSNFLAKKFFTGEDISIRFQIETYT